MASTVSPHHFQEVVLASVSQTLASQLDLLRKVADPEDEVVTNNVSTATLGLLEHAIMCFQGEVRGNPDFGLFKVDIDTGVPEERLAVPNGLARLSTDGTQVDGAQADDVQAQPKDADVLAATAHHSSLASTNTRDGAGNRPLRPLWEKEVNEANEESLVEYSSGAAIVTPSSPAMKTGTLNAESHRKLNQRIQYWLSPSSPPRQLWTIFLTFIILFDLVTMPLAAFGYEGAWARMSIAIVLTIDLGTSFFVGFEVRGRTELRLNKIVLHYLRTWFLLDFTIIVLDWVEILGFSTLSVSVGWALRILRLMRIFRLVRVVRIAHVIDSWTDHVASGALLTSIVIGKMLGFLILFCHCIGCLWYYMGLIDEERQVDSWIDGLVHLSIGYRYVISLKWALAQFTPSASPYQPKNVYEELFNVVLVFAGLVVFSSFVGTITSTLTAMRKRAEDRTHQHQLFKRYVKDNGVSGDLERRIEVFAQEHHRHAKRTVEKDLVFARRLPESLLLEMRSEVFAPVLCQHPVFGYLLLTHRASLLLICHRACGHEIYAKGDELFSYNNEAVKMVFIIVGSFEYYEGAVNMIEAKAIFEQGCWLNEASLYIHFRHKGRAIAKQDSDIVFIDALRFGEILFQRPRAFRDVQRYAVELQKQLNSQNLQPSIWNSHMAVEQMVGDVFGLGHGDGSWSVPRDRCLRHVRSNYGTGD